MKQNIDWQEHTGLIWHVIKLFEMPKYIRMDDLNSIGYETLWKCSKSFDPQKAKFSTYACRSLYRAFLTHLRKEAQNFSNAKSRREDLLEDKCFDSVDNEESVSYFLKSVKDEEEQDILHLRFWHDMSYREIAEIYGITREGMRQRFHRIIHRIRTTHELA